MPLSIPERRYGALEPIIRDVPTATGEFALDQTTVTAEVLPDVIEHTGVEPAPASQEVAFYKDLDGVHLGATPKPNNMGSTYVDERDIPVADIGLIVNVEQSSAGYTGLNAKSAEGFKVEALDPDAISKKTMWKGGDKVALSRDWGKLGENELADFGLTDFGRPGEKMGVVRITDPSGNIRFFKVGANFRGREDDWNVKGYLQEVYPSSSYALPAPVRELNPAASDSDGSSDPSLIKGNVAEGLKIDSRLVNQFSTAFRHATPDVWILHASDRPVKEATRFAHMAVDLLAEIAQTDPRSMDGTELNMEELGRRARLVSQGNRTDRQGFLSSIEDEDNARVAYLTAVRELIGREATSDNAHSYTFLTSQATTILEQMTSNGKTPQINGDSEIARKLQDVIEEDTNRAAEAKRRRAEVLKGSIYDPEREAGENEFHDIAMPHEKIVIDLAAESPLLTADQVFEAFYINTKTDTQGDRVEMYRAPALAAFVIGGQNFVLLDTRQAYGPNGLSSKTGNHYYKGGNDKGQFALLQIMDIEEDALYGRGTRARSFSFGGQYDANVQKIYDYSNPAQQGAFTIAPEVGTFEYDKDNNRVIIQPMKQQIDTTARSGSAEILPKNEIDKAPEETREKIKQWQAAVKSVEADTAALRERVQRDIEQVKARTGLSQEQIDAQVSRLEAELAKGPMRSWTYNGSRGDTWGREQYYHVSVDPDGNIIGDYLETRIDERVTNRPLPPGRRIIRKNPLLDLPQLGTGVS